MNDENAPIGLYKVIGGSRRLAALKLMVQDKKLAASAKIPCIIKNDADPISTSLSENIVRHAMHPADEYEAFKSLTINGKSPEQIALQFGCSTLTVRQRLSLGKVSQTVLGLFRAGSLNLDQVKAFTVSEVHEAQDALCEAHKSNFQNLRVDYIKRSLTSSDVSAQSKLATFVGVNDYETAGGAVRRDLFSEDVWLLDSGLLERLASEKLSRLADDYKAMGWSWVEICEGSPDRSTYTVLQPNVNALDEETEARLAELQHLYEAAEDEEAGELDSEISEIEDRHYKFSAEQKAMSGVYLSIGFDGPAVYCGIVLNKTGRNEPQAAKNDADERPALSAALQTTLLSNRTKALQAVLAQKPDLAFRVLVHSTLSASYHSMAKIRFDSPFSGTDTAELRDSKAASALLEAKLEAVNPLTVPQDPIELWSWLLERTNDELLFILAVIIAETVDAGSEDWTKNPACLQAQVAREAGLDMREWWTATAGTYFSRVSKQQVGEAIKDCGANPGNVSAEKKANLAERAERVSQAAGGWLPELFRLFPLMLNRKDAEL